MILYLSIIIFATILIAVLNISFMTLLNLSVLQIVLLTLIAVVSTIIIDGICAFVSAHLPDKIFERDRKIYSAGKKEIKFYECLKIKKWKDKVWELGKLNSFSKQKIEQPKNIEYLDKFVMESKKGIMGHLFSMILAIIVVLFMPSPAKFTIAIPVFVINIFMNLPSFMILRYNLPKLKTLIKFNKRHIERNNECENEFETVNVK